MRAPAGNSLRVGLTELGIDSFGDLITMTDPDIEGLTWTDPADQLVLSDRLDYREHREQLVIKVQRGKKEL